MSSNLVPLLRQAMALAAMWAVLVVPAYLLGGRTAAEGLSYAALLCFLPAGLLLLKSAVVRDENPLVDLVLGMGMRMAVVLAGAWLIVTVRPDMTGRTFLYWLIPLYVVALIVETQQAVQAESVRGTASSSTRGG